MTSHPRLLGRWRRTLQWGAAALWLLAPFLRVNGESLLRLDIPTLTLFLFGTALPVEQFYLIGLFCLSLLFLFLLLTMLLGRVWCGWGCPHTALADLAEGAARLLGLRVRGGRISGSWLRRMALYLLLLLFSLLPAAGLVWYFVSPYDYFSRLAVGTLGGWPLGATLTVAALLFLDAVLIRRLVCREFCPYGRFQAVLTDAATLALRLDPAEANRCINCLACLRDCPMGIDIRQGDQIECINCGRCLDACRRIMAKQGEQGLISYRFGSDEGFSGSGWRLALVFLIWLLITVGLLVAAWNLPLAALTVTRQGMPVGQGQLFSVLAVNRDRVEHTYRVEAFASDGRRITLHGPAAGISLGPGERRRLQLAMAGELEATAGPLRFTLRDENEREQATAGIRMPARPTP